MSMPDIVPPPSHDMVKGLHNTACPCCHEPFEYVGTFGNGAENAVVYWWEFRCSLGRSLLMPIDADEGK